MREQGDGKQTDRGEKVVERLIIRGGRIDLHLVLDDEGHDLREDGDLDG